MVVKLSTAKNADYFAKAAKKLHSTVAHAKDHAQVLIIEAMEHAETHGDWHGSLLPIMEVMLNKGPKVEGVFGSALGKAFAVYISTYTKLVYNPKGLNGRKLSKLTIGERWAWDKSKTFNTEEAKTVKWWTLKPQTNGDVAKPIDEMFKDKSNRFVVSFERFLLETEGMTVEAAEGYKAELLAMVNAIKTPTSNVLAPSTVNPVEGNGEEGTVPLVAVDAEDATLIAA